MTFLKRDFQIGALVACLGPQLNQFLSWCISGKSISWETQINNYSLSDLSTRGNLFLQTQIERRGRRLWFPGFLLYLLACESDQTLLQQLVSFPPSIGSKWKKFEFMSLGLVVIRNNLYVSEQKQTCSIQELFPGAIGNLEVLNFFVKLTSLNIATENKQWISKNKSVQTVDSVIAVSLEGIQHTISFSKDQYALLCAPGTGFVDARIHFSTPNDKPVLVVLQMKDTSSDKYLNVKDIQKIREVIGLLKKCYVGYEIICGIISSRLISDQTHDEIIKWGDSFLISKDQMPSFAPSLEHRFIRS